MWKLEATAAEGGPSIAAHSTVSWGEKRPTVPVGSTGQAKNGKSLLKDRLMSMAPVSPSCIQMSG